MLVKRKPTAAARGAGMFGSVAAAAPMDRRAFLKRSGLAAGGLAAAGAVSSMSMVGKAEAGPTTPGVEIVRKKSICTHCSVGCTVTAEVQNGVWVGPRAELGQPDQQRHPLRQGCRGAGTGSWRPPAEVPDEAGGRSVEAAELGSGHRRDRREAAGDPRESGAGVRVLAGLGEVLQRGCVSVPQDGRFLGHQYGGPSGAHLPLHDGRRCREHVGLRRHDQQLQRHP